MYFTMFVLFIVLIVGPIIASRFLKDLPNIPDQLIQPTGLNNNDTSNSQTGTAEAGGAAATSAAATAGAFRRSFASFAY